MKLLYNARIYTLDASHAQASAVAIENGRILALDEKECILPEFDGAEKQDMGGKTILPGLIDAHLHLQYYSLSLQKIDCETDTLDECLRRVEERVRTAQPGEWILGHVWNQNNRFSSPDGWYPQQRLSLMEAIEGYTFGAAYAAGTESYSGKLSPGYLADLIVLEQGPFAILSADLLESESVATMLNVERVWQK